MVNSISNKIILKILDAGYSIDRNGVVYTPKKEIKALNAGKEGYKRFTYRFDKNPRNVYVHKMQAYMKFGELAFSCVGVRHLNGDSLDNSWDNILIGTHSENMMDKSPLNRRLGSSSPKYNHEEIIRLNNEGFSYSEIMERCNISSKGTLSFIINKSLKQEGLK